MEKGFLYYGGTYCDTAPQARYRDDAVFADRPYCIDLGGQGDLSFPIGVMQPLTVQMVELLTLHGPVSMETLDRISYLVDEARMSHPDQVWNNGPIGPVPPAVAEFMAEQNGEQR
jgi:hypothetical protein